MHVSEEAVAEPAVKFQSKYRSWFDGSKKMLFFLG